MAERYLPARNAAASPYRFELDADPEAWFLEDEGYELAVFHSHLSSPPRPSRTDIENIGLWEGRPYVILTLSTGELAAWRIRDGRVEARRRSSVRTRLDVRIVSEDRRDVVARRRELTIASRVTVSYPWTAGRANAKTALR